MDTQTDYLKQIRKAYPDLEIIDSRLSPIKRKNNEILIVNEEVVFRFPRHQENAAAVLREAAVLRTLRGRLSIPIPEPVYIATDPDKGSGIFFGYCMLPGQPLSKTPLDIHQILLDENRFRQVVSQMANFIRELHSIPPDSLGVDLPRSDTREDIEQLYSEVRKGLFNYMRPDAVEWVKRIFDNYLPDNTNFEYKPAVRHGNLTGSNILFDPATGAVSGVLDFSSLALGDPAMDVAGLASVSEPFFSFLYELDPDQIGPMMRRAQFHKSTFALRKALTGLLENDPVAFDRGMEAYRVSDLAGSLNPNPRVS